MQSLLNVPGAESVVSRTGKNILLSVALDENSLVAEQMKFKVSP